MTTAYHQDLDLARVAPPSEWVATDSPTQLSVLYGGRSERLIRSRGRETLRATVFSVLQHSRSDWRTPASIGRQIGVPEAEVRAALDAMIPRLVRKPTSNLDRYWDYYRSRDRRSTWQERMWRAKAIFSKSSPGD